jgi:GntR family transcriptional regulator, transcriptional repressor for pyruvate dehydrogenase complex
MSKAPMPKSNLLKSGSKPSGAGVRPAITKPPAAGKSAAKGAQAKRRMAPVKDIAEAEVDAFPLAAMLPVARASIVDTVTEQIKREILRGALAIGAKLPPERDLAQSLQINRLTLRAALSRLEALGFIVTRHGAGTLVANWRERVGLDVLGGLLRAVESDAALYRKTLESLLEVRRILFSEAVALAAERAPAKTIELLRAAAKRQESRVDDPIAYARGDVDFLRILVQSTGNVALELILNTFAKFPDEQSKLVVSLYDERIPELYEAVIGAVQSRDPDAVRVGVREALTNHDAAWLDKMRRK